MLALRSCWCVLASSSLVAGCDHALFVQRLERWLIARGAATPSGFYPPTTRAASNSLRAELREQNKS